MEKYVHLTSFNHTNQQFEKIDIEIEIESESEREREDTGR
jgi:hypothetical protein